MSPQVAARVSRARMLASRLEERARVNPAQAPKLTELARKLRVGASMLENLGPTQDPTESDTDRSHYPD